MSTTVSLSSRTQNAPESFLHVRLLSRSSILPLSLLPPQPLHPFIGALEPRKGRGSRGQSLFLFGSQGLLGETWRENGCIRAGVGGQDFNSVKEQLV